MVDPFNDLHLVFLDFVTETTVFNKAFLVPHCMEAQPLAFVILWEGRVVLLQVLSPEVLVVLTFFSPYTSNDLRPPPRGSWSCLLSSFLLILTHSLVKRRRGACRSYSLTSGG